jgi:hypothetical protein
MKRSPFLMKASITAVLRCDGKFVVGGRASFVWETFLQRRVAGIPGLYEVTKGRGYPWHRLDWTMDEAEEALLAWGMFGKRRVKRMLTMRAGRARRGLPVG